MPAAPVRVAAVISAGAALIGMAPTAASAAYPERPISLIVAYAPGGGTDIIARVLAKYMEKYLGNNVAIVVQNKWKEMPWSDK